MSRKYLTALIFFASCTCAGDTFINEKNAINLPTFNNSLIKAKELNINKTSGNIVILPTPDIPFSIDKSALLWLSNIVPERVQHADISKWIEKYNKTANTKFRLPKFFEAERILKSNKSILGNFKSKEIWVSSNYRYSSFDFRIGQRFSGGKFKHEKNYLLLVKDL